MELKRTRFPQDREERGPYLFWCYDFSSESKTKESCLYSQHISILDDLSSTDNVEMLPDPTLYVVGVHFEKSEADNIDRSLSPSTYSRSQRGKDDEFNLNTDRERDPITNRTNQALTGRDASGELISARDRQMTASKDKNKSTLTSFSNKYMKPRGRLSFDSKKLHQTSFRSRARQAHH